MADPKGPASPSSPPPLGFMKTGDRPYRIGPFPIPSSLVGPSQFFQISVPTHDTTLNLGRKDSGVFGYDGTSLSTRANLFANIGANTLIQGSGPIVFKGLSSWQQHSVGEMQLYSKAKLAGVSEGPIALAAGIAGPAITATESTGSAIPPHAGPDYAAVIATAGESKRTYSRIMAGAGALKALAFLSTSKDLDSLLKNSDTATGTADSLRKALGTSLPPSLTLFGKDGVSILSDKVVGCFGHDVSMMAKVGASIAAADTVSISGLVAAKMFSPGRVAVEAFGYADLASGKATGISARLGSVKVKAKEIVIGNVPFSGGLQLGTQKIALDAPANGGKVSVAASSEIALRAGPAGPPKARLELKDDGTGLYDAKHGLTMRVGPAGDGCRIHVSPSEVAIQREGGDSTVVVDTRWVELRKGKSLIRVSDDKIHFLEDGQEMRLSKQEVAIGKGRILVVKS